jgi:hypothetical protein
VTGGVSPYVTIQVAKPGVDIDTAEAEDLVYINSVRADTDGSYSFSIPFDEPGEFPYVLTFGGFDGGIYDETYINGAVKGTINYIPYFTFGGGTAAGQTLTVTSYIEDGPAEYKLILALYSDNKLLGVELKTMTLLLREIPAPHPMNCRRRFRKTLMPRPLY